MLVKMFIEQKTMVLFGFEHSNREGFLELIHANNLYRELVYFIDRGKI